MQHFPQTPDPEPRVLDLILISEVMALTSLKMPVSNLTFHKRRRQYLECTSRTAQDMDTSR